jgi:hypothetical protein
LVWNQLILATKVGLLPDTIFKDITIQVQMPTVVTRDMDMEARVNQTYSNMGIKSKITIANEIGLNWEQERKNMEMEPKLDTEEREQEKGQDAEAEAAADRKPPDA